MTNFERIKSFSIDEMAKFLNSEADNYCFDMCAASTGDKYKCYIGEDASPKQCNECIKKWLSKEVRL